MIPVILCFLLLAGKTSGNRIVFPDSYGTAVDSTFSNYTKEQIEELKYNSWRGSNLLAWLTNGYYKRWQAEGEPEGSPEYWNDEPLKIRYGKGYIYKDRRATGWSSGVPVDTAGPQMLFSIPALSMASCHRLVPPGINFSQVNYVFNARLKAEIPDSLSPMEPLLSIVIYCVAENGSRHSLKQFHLTSADIDTFYNGIQFSFDLPVILKDGAAMDIKAGMEFYTHNKAKIDIDLVDIYDNEVGARYLAFYTDTRDQIAGYMKWLKKRLPQQEQQNKEFLLFGMSPPHSAYSVEPYRLLERMLKELGIQ